jgi:hypothetical protein
MAKLEDLYLHRLQSFAISVALVSAAALPARLLGETHQISRQ